LLATTAPTVVGNVMYLSQRNPASGVCEERLASFDISTFNLLKNGEYRTAPYLNSKDQRQSQYWAQSANASLANGYTGEMTPAPTTYTPESLVGVESVSAIQGFQGSRPLSIGGKVFASMGGSLVCYDSKTMALLWQKSLLSDPNREGGFMISQPIPCGPFLAIACMDGTIRMMDFNGNEKKRYPTQEKFRMPPIVMNGTLFATSTRGKMVAVNTGKPEWTGWPCWGGNLARTNQIKP
jgi:outer membrane protein assembly factor BamB